jgi:hypothetical protein
LQGISATAFETDPQAETTFIDTIKQVDGLENATVGVTGVSEDTVATTSFAVQNIAGVAVSYSVTMELVTVDEGLLSDDGSGRRHLTEQDAAQVINTVTENIDVFVTSGQFNTTMRSIATELGSVLQEVSAARNVTIVSTGSATLAVILPPTSAPTFLYSDDGTAPDIKSVSIDARNLNASVSVTLAATETSERSGTLFCLAQLASMAPPSNVDSIRSNGVSQDYTTLDVPVSLLMTGLSPVKEYDLYCAALSAGLSMTPIETVQEQVSGFETACCKTISYTQAPSSVYTDLSFYSASSTAYLFSFSLSDAPGDALAVTPFALDSEGVAVEASNFVASPASFEYARSSSGTGLLGTYLFIGLDSIPADYTIGLSLTGSSAGEYEAPTDRTLTVLATSTPLPAPSLVSALFSDTGASIIVTFSESTDFARITTTSFTCSDLLAYAGANTSSCTWTSDTVVTASLPTFSSIALIEPGDDVTLRGGMVRAACEAANATDASCDDNEVTARQTVASLPPVSPSLPNVILNIPGRVSTCDDLVVDATSSTGSAGRDYSVISWIVVTSNATVENILDTYLNSFNRINTRITIPSAMLPAADYFISLSLQNWLGGASFSQVTVKVVDETNIPQATILGSNFLVIKAVDEVSVRGTGSLPSCASSSIFLSYNWTVSLNGQTLGVTSTSISPKRLRLPSYTLLVGKTYTAQLAVTATSPNYVTTSNSTSTASITIFVDTGPVIAQVAG